MEYHLEQHLVQVEGLVEDASSLLPGASGSRPPGQPGAQAQCVIGLRRPGGSSSGLLRARRERVGARGAAVFPV